MADRLSVKQAVSGVKRTIPLDDIVPFITQDSLVYAFLLPGDSIVFKYFGSTNSRHPDIFRYIRDALDPTFAKYNGEKYKAFRFLLQNGGIRIVVLFHQFIVEKARLFESLLIEKGLSDVDKQIFNLINAMAGPAQMSIKNLRVTSGVSKVEAVDAVFDAAIKVIQSNKGNELVITSDNYLDIAKDFGGALRVGVCMSCKDRKLLYGNRCCDDCTNVEKCAKCDELEKLYYRSMFPELFGQRICKGCFENERPYFDCPACQTNKPSARSGVSINEEAEYYGGQICRGCQEKEMPDFDCPACNKSKSSARSRFSTDEEAEYCGRKICLGCKEKEMPDFDCPACNKSKSSARAQFSTDKEAKHYGKRICIGCKEKEMPDFDCPACNKSKSSARSRFSTNEEAKYCGKRICLNCARKESPRLDCPACNKNMSGVNAGVSIDKKAKYYGEEICQGCVRKEKTNFDCPACKKEKPEARSGFSTDKKAKYYEKRICRGCKEKESKQLKKANTSKLSEPPAKKKKPN